MTYSMYCHWFNKRFAGVEGTWVVKRDMKWLNRFRVSWRAGFNGWPECREPVWVDIKGDLKLSKGLWRGLGDLRGWKGKAMTLGGRGGFIRWSDWFVDFNVWYSELASRTVVIAERWRSDRTAISVEVRVPAAATKPGSFLVRGEEKALTTSKCV